MVLLHLDGFDTYAATADLALRYPGTTSGTLSTTAGRFGGGCMFPNSTSNLGLIGSVVIPHSGAGAIIAGGAHNFAPTSAYPIMSFLNSLGAGSSDNVEVSLGYNPTLGGILQLKRGGFGSGASAILASTAQGFPTGAWHHIEAKATVADSGGTVEVRVNGQTVLTYTGDTRNTTSGTAGIDRVNFAGYSNTVGGWDDIYILDTTGSTANNFLGDVRVNTLAPTSDAAVQFTRSTGTTNWSCVDEGRQNGDTDYVQSATVGHIDRYGYADLPATVTVVHAVQATAWGRKTDAATRTWRQIVTSGATAAPGGVVGLTTSYAPYPYLLSADPATAGTWSSAAVNALQAGFEVVS